MVRKTKKIRFGQLRKVMLDLGYQIRPVDQHYVAFVRPDRDLFVALPDVPSEAEVRPIDLLSVQKTRPTVDTSGPARYAVHGMLEQRTRKSLAATRALLPKSLALASAILP